MTQDILRKSGSRRVIVRTRGDRRFHEIPASEIAAALDRIEKEGLGMVASIRFERLLKHYEVRRKSSNIRDRLVWIDTHRHELTDV